MSMAILSTCKNNNNNDFIYSGYLFINVLYDAPPSVHLRGNMSTFYIQCASLPQTSNRLQSLDAYFLFPSFLPLSLSLPSILYLCFLFLFKFCVFHSFPSYETHMT